MEDGLHHLRLGGADEGTAPRKGFVGDYAEREQIRKGARRLHLKLLGRDVEQGALEGGLGLAAGFAGDAEIDDLHRIVVHDEDVAGLDIAVDEALFMGGMETMGGLGDDFKHAGDAQPRAAILDEAIERGARQERHHEEGFFHTILVEFADVVDVDDIGVDHGGEDAPLFVEKLEGGGIFDVEDGFEGHFPLHEPVDGAIHHAHPSAPKHFAEFVPLL